MVRVITQETFDDVVKENVAEFDMEYAEAVREAKEQFEQQGVNLANIVISEKESHEVLDALKLLAPASTNEQKLEGLETITKCCRDDLAQRVMATNNGAYSFLLRLASSSEKEEVRVAALGCLSVVMDTNPDHLENQGISLMEEVLLDDKLITHALDWLLVCCVRHEGNRQRVVNSDVLQATYNIAKAGEREHLLRVKRVWVAIVQDDDIRVPFGKAHDTARELVESYEALKILTKSLTKFSSDTELMCLSLSALASLSVRNEYCQEVVDQGGLQFIHDILLNHTHQEDLVTRSLTLMKVLAGNDKVKSEIAKGGGLPLILNAIDIHILKGVIVEQGLQAVTAICLRQPDNSKQVMEAEGANLITTAMARHPKHRRVQAACAAAIRNIVSRDRILGQPFVDLGVEDLLNEALKLHGDQVGDTLRSALRDLDLKVELKCRWTGTNAGISKDQNES